MPKHSSAHQEPVVQAGIVADLPTGWSVVPFRGAIRHEKARVTKVPRSSYQKAGQYPVIDQGQEFIAGYWDADAQAHREPLPVIVFGDHTRIFKFVDFPFVAGADGTQILFPRTTRFDPFFLYLAFSALNIPSRGYNRHFSLLKQQSVIAPPLPEQRAIAFVLRTVQNAKEACEKVIDATRQLKVSLMQHLFTYGPVPFDRAHTVARKETEIGTLPEQWLVVSLGDLELLVQYGTSSRCQTSGSGYPVLRIPNIVGGAVDTTDLKYLAAPSAEAERHLLASGDILFVRTNGVRENVGRCAVYRDKPTDALFASYLIRARVAEDKALPEFVQLFTETKTGRQSFYNRASGAADGKFNINSQTIRSTILPLPPVSVQREIIAQLSATDAKLDAEEARRAALGRLFDSLLHHLMTSKVRLPEFANEHSL